MEAHLSHHHRETVERIFNHEAGAVEWRHVLSLLEHVGTVEHEHNGKLRVTVGPETETFSPPKSKDTQPETLHDLRRMLTAAGIAPGSAPQDDERTRDYGDSRWGDPRQS